MRNTFFFIIVISVFILFSCENNSEKTYFKISGFTQGTSYHITYALSDSVNLQESVDSILLDFDMSMSAWVENSVLSRINRNETDQVDEKFKALYRIASEVNKNSGGAFDLTVMPLVNAWGFGPGMKSDIEKSLIDSILQFVGMDKIKLEGNTLIKQDPRVSIDVNAIAQGFSVDIVASFFESLGISDYMVEIGGEVKTRGKNPKGESWKIGVDRPEYGNLIPGMNMQVILSISGTSMATSGNYRKYYEEDGIKYSHSIDPETGYPIKHEVLSATVIMKDCMDADAYATACMISGLEKSKRMIESVDGLEAYLIYANEKGEFEVYYSDGFQQYIYKEIEKP